MRDTLTVVVYQEGLTEYHDAAQRLLNRRGLRFETIYPGGLYSVCSFFIPMRSTDTHEFKERRRVAIFSGLRMLWEGVIDAVTYTSTKGAEGLQVQCTGYWGSLLKRRRWDKIWCDTRLTEEKWVWSITAGMQENKFRADRYNRLRITPVETGMVAYDDASFIYTLPAGQTVDRITGTYAMYEGTQNWQMDIRDVAGGTTLNLINSSGTASFSGTPAAGCGTVGFYFYNIVDCTVDYDLDIYAQITDVKIYTESGTPTVTNIVKSIRNKLSLTDEMAIDESQIGENTQVLEPCFMQGETMGDFLSKLAAYGDTSLNPWAVGVKSSQYSLVTDYKPVMYFEQQPAMTDYDLVLRMEEIDGGASITMAYDEVINYIYLEYTDINGNRVRVTPEDDSDLKDDTSIDQFGQRDTVLKLGDTGVTEAKIFARRHLEWFKYARPRLTRPATISGTIRKKDKQSIPVSWVTAGQRVLIENYLQEIGGSNLIFLITQTTYDEESGKLTIVCGTPNPLDVIVARWRGGL